MLPTHGMWCNTRIWRTKCPHCEAPTYFFQCNCGSKVFFDKLGSPWPIHDCDTSWANNLVRTRDSSGGIIVEIAEGITVQRLPEKFSVDINIVSKARQHKMQPNQDPIVAIKPEDSSGKVSTVGILRDWQVEVDVLKSLKLPVASSMVSAFLGPLAKGKWGKATLHEPSSHQNIHRSYTFWVASKHIAEKKNSKGVTVKANISPLVIPQIGAVWNCEDYEVLG